MTSPMALNMPSIQSTSSAGRAYAARIARSSLNN
jgi:hypothetical protein